MAEFSLQLNDDQLQLQTGSTSSPTPSSARRARSGTSGRRRRGRSSRRPPRSASTGWTSWPTRMMGDPSGLTLPVTMEELFWGDAGIALSIFGSGLAAAGIAGTGTPEQIFEWVPQCYGDADDVKLGALLRVRARRRLRRELAAHPGRVRRGQGRVGAQRHQGVDHQRRHRQRPRGRGVGRPGAQGPRPGQLHRPAGHQGPLAGPEVQEARHPGLAHRRGRARRRARARLLPPRRQGEARRQAGQGARAPEDRREAAGHGHLRGHPPGRRGHGRRHRPRGLRVRAWTTPRSARRSGSRSS